MGYTSCNLRRTPAARAEPQILVTKVPISPAAVNRDLTTLRIVFNFAIRLGKASRNPVVGVKFLKEDNRPMRVLTADEEVRYLSAASPFLRDVAILMLETACARGKCVSCEPMT